MDRILDLDEGVHAAESTRRGWIHSPAFDLAFLILAPLAGFALAVVGLSYSVTLPAVIFAAAYVLGIPHYLASFAFFLGDENRAYARGAWPLFYVAPAAICVAVGLLYASRAAPVVHAVIFVWNIYHVATQSSGVLSLYRRLAGGGQEERRWAHGTLLAFNAAMALWSLDAFPPLRDSLVAIHRDLPVLVVQACLVAGAGCAIGYARQVRRRGFAFSAAEAACLASGLALFTPYLWIADANLATLTMLAGHFIQYLALVWLVSRRKYTPPAGSAAQRWLGRLGGSWPALLVFMATSGSLFFIFDKLSHAIGAYMLFMIAFNCLALVHFYLDGLIWAFRNPFIRRTVGPFLTLEAHRLR